MNKEDNKEDLYYSQFMKEIEIISKETGIEIPKTYYRYGLCECYKCGKKILAFAWPDESPKEQPMPKTIGKRATKMSGEEYWNNSCPYCNAVQGKYFLFSEPDGPFFGLEYWIIRNIGFYA